MLATSAEASTDPYVRLTGIVEESLPALFSAAGESRVIEGAIGAPDVPYVDPEWPADEERLLRRYNFLTRVAGLLHPSAPITPAGVASAVRLVDPVTGAVIIPGAWADAARRAADAYDMRAARGDLVRGVLDYAQRLQNDTRDALDRLNARYNSARSASVLAQPPTRPLVVSPRPVPAPQAVPSQRPPATIAQPSPGPTAAVSSVLGRRLRSQMATAPVAPRRSVGWSAALQRLIPTAQPTSFGPPAPARVESLQQATQQQPFAQEEEEQEPLVIKRRRRRTPLSIEQLPIEPTVQTTSESYADDVLNALLGGEEAPMSPYGALGTQAVSPALVGQWNLASALTAAARAPAAIRSPEYLAPPSAATQRTPSPLQIVGETPSVRAEGGIDWPVDAYVQTVAPVTFRRDIDLPVLQVEARRARSLADAVQSESVASMAGAVDGMADPGAAQDRADYLDGLVAYAQAARRETRRAREPFEAAYWYRVVAAGGSGPLGVPTETAPLSAAAAVHGPYATIEDATADAEAVGFDPDAAIADAALAWAIGALGGESQNVGPVSTIFQVRRPAERDPAVPRQLANRADPSVERWAVAVAVPRRDQTSPHEGAFRVLAWDRAVGGRARRAGVRDLFPSAGGPPSAVVAVYETPDPATAASIQDDLDRAMRVPAPDGARLSANVAAATDAHYPGTAVDVTTNADGSEVTVTVRLPVSLADTDQDRLLALARAVYGIAATAGARNDSIQSRLVGIDGTEAPIPSPPLLVGATSA
ncbi:hypothetical protein pmac_cds_336 [Pandoravirus macleodensis]|uniref:Uncharacterized protein n=1 Tax=Pandoravirus macleodensis TaxID=2107707 RepID=A0A2U7UF08_9VIRU|nr:hypothetical protein pmac_cds_336 [Pandoravirus macleodensis]AVK77024.1 hypothetical protein pmac_cds_336 [Pandoravirus macleodensis]